eukprot:COSAG03_NODE_14300_length_469_cov_0.821622_1_plen_68_part_10
MHRLRVLPKHLKLIWYCRLGCEQWTQGQIAGGNSDFNTTIDGTTAPFAVSAWYRANRLGAQKGPTEFV